MDHQRQPGIHGQADLSGESALLHFALRRLRRVFEPDLADGDDPRPGAQALEFAGGIVVPLPGMQRVQARGRHGAVGAMAQLEQGRPAASPDAGDQKGVDPLAPGQLQFSLEIECSAQTVEVDVAVEEAALLPVHKPHAITIGKVKKSPQ